MEKELKFLIEVVTEASKLITDDFKVDDKGDKAKSDLVTTYDYEVEKFITAKINKHYPDFDIVSEEYKSDAKITKNCFTIDPIDGTINFANRLPLWAIQVACIKEGDVVASVIYLPKLNDMYYADSSGAYKNGKKITVNNNPIDKSLYEIDGGYRLPAIARMMKHSKHYRNVGCAAVAFCFVADGGFGGVCFRNDTLWDYVPGLYLIKQAGGYVHSESRLHIGANTPEFLEILKTQAQLLEADKNIL